MKKNHLYKILLLFVYPSFSTGIYAQDFENGGAYISYISDNSREITKNFMSYSSAVAHGKSARKVDKTRQELLASVKESTKKIAAMPAYKGDKSLRDTAASFLKMAYIVLNEDYGKIINLEDVSEQSYDAMEAYLLAQDLANEKLKQAADRLNKTEKTFADKNQVTLVESDNSELSKKVEITGKVNDYYRKVYLIFFKSNKQELYMMEAINNKNVNSIEQNKNSLQKYSEEGISKIDTMKEFNGDRSMIIATKQTLEFYRSEAKDKIPIISGFFIKEENFNKIKKAFDAKKPADHTPAEVEQFNNAVIEYNKGIVEYNKTNDQLNETRKRLIDYWNKTALAFLDKHTPKYK